MSFRLYDTATRQVRDFVPKEPDKVGIYLCGATVQAPPHVGHIRSGVAFDVLVRWLQHSGYDVTFIRNVTDIDDKILAKSADADQPWWAWAMQNERAFSWAYDQLGCEPPTYEPRATGHVPEMIALIRKLEQRGHAYAPGNGDVYFDVRSLPSYGSLSNQRLDDMEPAADADTSGKRDPRDFALWKGAKPGEPSWETPWGPGRPGWHLECSSMASKYLGAEFDIHAGGIDLVFPHHENELAQSRGAGEPFTRYWMHNGWVTAAGEKMSKSLGNSLLIPAVLERVRAIDLRYYLVAGHYRSHIEFSFEALDEAATTFRRIEGFVQRATETVGAVRPSVMCADFAIAMDDDLGVPAALAALQEVVREGNAALAAGDHGTARGALASVRAMLEVLGLDPLGEPWVSRGAGGDERLRTALDALVRSELDARQEARAGKDFATADLIRDRLKAAGVAVDDTPAGPRWTLAAPTDEEA